MKLTQHLGNSWWHAPIVVCFNYKSKKKRKKKVKPFKNPNSSLFQNNSLFQNKTSGIHHSN